jgi:hypothetical protein
MIETINILEQAQEFFQDFKGEWSWKKNGDNNEKEEYSRLVYFSSILDDHLRDLVFRQNSRRRD